MKNRTKYPGGRWEPGEARYGSKLVEGFRIRTGDGIELRAAAAFPTDLRTGEIVTDETFPVLVEWTCYKEFGPQPVLPNTWYCGYGYISAMVWIRGANGSDGDLLMTGDLDDSHYVVEWAQNLEGSNGDVAFYGASYPAGMALVAASQNPSVKCIIANNNSFENCMRQCWLISGVPTMGGEAYVNAIPFLYGDTPASRKWSAKARHDIEEGDGLAYDGEFWSTRLPMHFAKNIVESDTPVLLHTGTGDLMDNLIIKSWTALQNAYAGRPVDAQMLPDQEVSPKWQMIYGHWEHVQALDCGLNLQWLETWMRGVDTGLQNTKKPLHLWEGGSNRWFNTAQYPISRRSDIWYLGADGAADRQKPAEGEAELAFAYPHEEKGMLTFRTKELAEDYTIAGAVSAKLYASTPAENLLLIANVYDDDGTERKEVARGVVLGSQREVDPDKTWYDEDGNATYVWARLTHDDYLTPGEIYELEMFLNCRQWKFVKGHRIVFTLTTKSDIKDVPAEGPILVNSNKPGRINRPQRESIRDAVFTVYFGGENASSILLPKTENDAQTYVEAGMLPTPWFENARRMGEDVAFPLPLDWEA